MWHSISSICGMLSNFVQGRVGMQMFEDLKQPFHSFFVLLKKVMFEIFCYLQQLDIRLPEWGGAEGRGGNHLPILQQNGQILSFSYCFTCIHVTLLLTTLFIQISLVYIGIPPVLSLALSRSII